MKNITYSKSIYELKAMFVVMVVLFIIDNNYNLVHAQQVSDLNTGNSSDMASDTFLELEDSIEFIKELVNNTQSAIDDGNTTAAKDLLDQVYDELIQISTNSNNLIWDLSNQGN